MNKGEPLDKPENAWIGELVCSKLSELTGKIVLSLSEGLPDGPKKNLALDDLRKHRILINKAGRKYASIYKEWRNKNG